jgi:tetratricopeptide (TPR) repeat protein
MLAGCASLTKQGREALAEGQYERALSLFQRANENDKDDSEAKEGLRQAQQMWLERKLIDVRLLRLGSNFGDSESLLLKIIHNENRWQVFPVGAAFSTQNEEVHLFAQRVQKRIDEYLQKSNPLAAQFEFNRNNFILEKALGQNTTTVNNDIYVRGKLFCQTAQKSLKPDEYYTGLWLQSTCRIWKQTIKLPTLKNSVALFKDTKIKSDVMGLSPELTAVLDDNIRKAFLQSKWHDESGKVFLDLGVRGKFNSEQFEANVQRAKTYYVQIPYQETSKRIKDVNRDSGILGLISLLAGTSPTESVTDNGDGTETVVTTRYRSEERVHNYFAVEMKSLKRLEGQLQAALDKQTFSMDLNQRYSFQEDRHKENFPDVGLSPTNPVFVTDAQWIQVVSQELIGDLTNKLQQSWIERFCSPELSGPLSEREQAYRCGFQVNAAAPEKLRQFYFKTWQVNYEDWQELVANTRSL